MGEEGNEISPDEEDDDDIVEVTETSPFPTFEESEGEGCTDMGGEVQPTSSVSPGPLNRCGRRTGIRNIWVVHIGVPFLGPHKVLKRTGRKASRSQKEYGI
jgi:hypothetical protein